MRTARWGWSRRSASLELASASALAIVGITAGEAAAAPRGKILYAHAADAIPVAMSWSTRTPWCRPTASLLSHLASQLVTRQRSPTPATGGTAANRLTMQNDGNIVLRDAGGRVYWTSIY